MNKEDRLRELVYKSWHRGCKETDILLGRFAKARLADVNDNFIDIYSSLITEPDWDIYAWLVNEKEPPANYLDVIKQIQDFHKSENNSTFF